MINELNEGMKIGKGKDSLILQHISAKKSDTSINMDGYPDTVNRKKEHVAFVKKHKYRLIVPYLLQLLVFTAGGLE